MQADLPHALYHLDRKGPKKPTQGAVDRAWKLQQEADRKARERRAARQRKEGYTVAELFRGDAEK